MDTSKILEWLKNEYAGVRSGQASPSILDSVRVDMYGSKMPINQVASILGEGPKSLMINPWDKSAIKAIDTAIREANLGVSVSASDQGVRVSFPELTADTRQTLIKVVKQKLEEARIRVRTERQRLLNEMKDLDEDSQKRAKDKLQKEVDEINKKLEEVAEKKEAEIAG
jgi:ribosome recycling factor